MALSANVPRSYQPVESVTPLGLAFALVIAALGASLHTADEHGYDCTVLGKDMLVDEDLVRELGRLTASA